MWFTRRRQRFARVDRVAKKSKKSCMSYVATIVVMVSALHEFGVFCALYPVLFVSLGNKRRCPHRHLLVVCASSRVLEPHSQASKPFSRCPDTRRATCSIAPLPLTRAFSLARPSGSADTHRPQLFCRFFSNSLICGRAQDLPDLAGAGTSLLSSLLTPDLIPSCPPSRLRRFPSRLSTTTNPSRPIWLSCSPDQSIYHGGPKHPERHELPDGVR